MRAPNTRFLHFPAAHERAEFFPARFVDLSHEGYPIVLWFTGRGEGAEHVYLPKTIDAINRRSRRVPGEPALWYSGPLGVFVQALVTNRRPEGFPRVRKGLRGALWPSSLNIPGRVKETILAGLSEDHRDVRPATDVWRNLSHLRIRHHPAIWRTGLKQRHYLTLMQRAADASLQLAARRAAVEVVLDAPDGGKHTHVVYLPPASASRLVAQQRARRLPNALPWWHVVPLEELTSDEYDLLRTMRRPGEYLQSKESVGFVWYAADAEAAAGVELLHAVRAKASVRRCRACDIYFLRPSGAPGRFCLDCRRLTWRQQRAVTRVHPMLRRGLAETLLSARSAQATIRALEGADTLTVTLTRMVASN